MHAVQRGSAISDVTVGVVVVTYNSAPLVEDFAAALRAALGDVHAAKVVAVDNASSDDTVAALRRLEPPVEVIAVGQNEGYAAGINRGVNATGPADVIMVLNPDVRLEAGAVAKLIAALDRPGVGIAVPVLMDVEGRISHSLRREPSILRAWGEALLGGSRASRFPTLGETISDAASYQRPTTAAWATGAAMVISRACWEETGPWDESFFLYSEETDFALRARDAGHRLVLVPEARGVHVGGELSNSSRLWAMQVWNRIRLFRARHSRFATMVFRAGVVVNELLRAVGGSARHRAGLWAALHKHGRPPEVGGPQPGQTRTRSSTSPSHSAFVCFSSHDWWYHNRAHSDIQLMRHVAQHRRVLFVNSLTMRMPLPGRSTMPLRRIWRKAKSMAKFVRRPLPDLPHFYVMTPVMIPLYGSAFARRCSAALVGAQIRIVMRALRLSNPAIVVTIPTAWDVARRLPHRALIYNRSDLHSSFPEADREVIAGLETQLMAHADHVMYASSALLEAEAPRIEGRAVFLDHGVDLEHFRRRSVQEEPEDLRRIPHPRVGFFGGLDDYLVDFDLLDRVARELPDAHVVLIGDATYPMERFDHHENVHWLGYRPYADIPAYGSGFDVALMPWLDNEWIASANPIKMKEYLALGLSIVSTDFPEVHRYAENIRIADTADAFVQSVRDALLHPHDPQAQRLAVAEATWQRRSLELIALTEQGTADGEASEPQGPEQPQHR